MNGLQKSDFLIIVGGAPCVLNDLATIPEHDRFDFMLVGEANVAAPHIKHVDYHVSHENDFKKIKAQRQANRLNIDYISYSNESYPGVDKVFPDLSGPTCSFECHPRFGSKDPRNHHFYSGSSAMLAVKIGLRLGYRKIILAGCPLSEGHYANFQKGWFWVADLLQYCPVRSMGGFIKKLLGRYSEAWLNDEYREVPLDMLYYSTEPYPVLGGPLYLGYREYLAGNKDKCREIIANFYASVFVSRQHEFSTERFVHKIYEERKDQMPDEKANVNPQIVQMAAERRYDQLHLPVLESIITKGYISHLGKAITMIKKNDKYLVRDGKNRCSILAAMGKKTIPNVIVEEYVN